MLSSTDGGTDMWVEILQALPVGLSEAAGSVGLSKLLASLKSRKETSSQLLNDLESIEAGHPPTRSAEVIAEELALTLVKDPPEALSQFAIGHGTTQQIATDSGIVIKAHGNVQVGRPF
jgi:hypothetical protein